MQKKFAEILNEDAYMRVEFYCVNFVIVISKINMAILFLLADNSEKKIEDVNMLLKKKLTMSKKMSFLIQSFKAFDE